MNILFFNINHCRNDPAGIKKFFDFHKSDIDVFCIQEVSYNAEHDIDKILKDFTKKHIHKELGTLGVVNNATYVKNKFKHFSFQNINTNFTNVSPSVLLSVQVDNLKYNILNYHGVYVPGDKLDTSYRINASNLIVENLKNLEGIKIIGGDFNLLPNTKSVHIFQHQGYKNLINDFNIKTTRNKNAWKLFPNNPQYFADYVFTCKNTIIKNFEVIQNDISDHLPMVLRLSNNL